MIVRVFQVRVYEGREAEFRKFFVETALPLVKSQPGVVSVTAGLPHEDSPQDFTMIMVWKDVASLKAFAGKDWQKPHIHPDEAGVVSDRRLSHYVLVESEAIPPP